MKQQNQSPKYATLLYEVRKRLDISIAEYFYLDMVYHLSHDGWCYKSLDNIGDDMGLSRIGVVKLRDRLIKKGLIKKNIKGHVKTGEAYNLVIRSDDSAYNKVTKPYNKVYPSVKQSIPKNNNRITIENRDFEKEDNRGAFSPAKERVRDMLKQKGILKQ